MKKIWILENWVSRDKLNRQLDDARQMRMRCDNDPEMAQHRDTADEVIKIAESLIAKHPEGFWSGTEGKISYRDFCYVAKANIRRHRTDGTKYRVVSAEIEDNAKYWCGYVNATVNDGVLRYLLATA